MLKTVPKISPFPIGFCPTRIKKKPAKMAVEIVRVQYFFCICLSVSIIGIYDTILLFSYLKNLTIDDVCTTDNP